MTLDNVAMIEGLIGHKELSEEFECEMFRRILDMEFNHSQVAAALALLRMRGESPSLVMSGAQEILARAIKPPRPDAELCDIVGTGGDGITTINVSTIGSLVAASLGLKVAKHGSVAVSSKCGSADVLKELGMDISVPAAGLKANLERFGWVYLFAADYHPSFQAMRPIRAELGIKTIFNLLGPLVNPMLPEIMLLGVNHERLVVPFAMALQSLKKRSALVVHGSGIDEIALHGPTLVAHLHDGHIATLTITPADLGLKTVTLDEIKGHGPKGNASEFLNILSGHGSDAQTNMVAANVGGLLYAAGRGELKQCVAQSVEAIRSQSALALFNEIKEAQHGASRNHCS